MDIKIENLTHIYGERTPFERIALNDITLSIAKGSYTAIIGHTGSGKSTLIQHLNGLLKPSRGTVHIGSNTITAGRKTKDLKKLRQHVGLVFQYPEHQLFEETVEKDICFGPMNFGVSEKAAKRRAKELISVVGLPEHLLLKSPFQLSGGQMRRVAIAGVLAMNPKVLILDEPTAGLDPVGRREMMELFYKLHQEKELTTILVTHHMNDAAMYADRIIVMNEGAVLLDGPREKIFQDTEMLQSIGLDIPDAVRTVRAFAKKFSLPVPTNVYSVEETARFIANSFQARMGK